VFSPTRSKAQTPDNRSGPRRLPPGRPSGSPGLIAAALELGCGSGPAADGVLTSPGSVTLALPLKEETKKRNNRNSEVQTAQQPPDCLAWVAFKRRWPIGQFHGQAESDPHGRQGHATSWHFQQTRTQGRKSDQISRAPNTTCFFGREKKRFATSFSCQLPRFRADQTRGYPRLDPHPLLDHPTLFPGQDLSSAATDQPPVPTAWEHVRLQVPN
jgi:hypothetical protein